MRSLRSTSCALSFAAAATTPYSATADPVHDEVAVTESVPTRSGQTAARGAFLPFTIGASTEGTYGKILSGYDGSRRGFVYDGAAEASVVGRLSVRAGYSSADLSGHESALLGARFQLFSQKRQGIDLGAGLFYLPQGIDGEGLVRTSLFAGGEIGKVALLGSASYGQDPEGDDHHAELTMATLVPV